MFKNLFDIVSDIVGYFELLEGFATRTINKHSENDSNKNFPSSLFYS